MLETKRARSARHQFRRGREKLETYPPHYAGLDVARLRDRYAALEAALAEVEEGERDLADVDGDLGFLLWPEDGPERESWQPSPELLAEIAAVRGEHRPPRGR